MHAAVLHMQLHEAHLAITLWRCRWMCAGTQSCRSSLTEGPHHPLPRSEPPGCSDVNLVLVGRAHMGLALRCSNTNLALVGLVAARLMCALGPLSCRCYWVPTSSCVQSCLPTICPPTGSLLATDAEQLLYVCRVQLCCMQPECNA